MNTNSHFELGGDFGASRFARIASKVLKSKAKTTAKKPASWLKAQREKLAAKKAATEKIAAAKAAAERKAAAAKVAAAKAEAAKVAAQKLQQQKLAANKAAQEKLARDRQAALARQRAQEAQRRAEAQKVIQQKAAAVKAGQDKLQRDRQAFLARQRAQDAQRRAAAARAGQQVQTAAIRAVAPVMSVAVQPVPQMAPRPPMPTYSAPAAAPSYAPSPYAPASASAPASAQYDDEGYEDEGEGEYEEDEAQEQVAQEEPEAEEQAAQEEPEAEEPEETQEEPEEATEESSEEMGFQFLRRQRAARHRPHQLFGATNTHPLACAEFGAPALNNQLDFKKLLSEVAKKAGSSAVGITATHVLKDPRVQTALKQQALDQTDAQIATQVRQTREGATSFVQNYGKYVGGAALLGVAFLIYRHMESKKKKGEAV